MLAGKCPQGLHVFQVLCVCMDLNIKGYGRHLWNKCNLFSFWQETSTLFYLAFLEGENCQILSCFQKWEKKELLGPETITLQQLLLTGATPSNSRNIVSRSWFMSFRHICKIKLLWGGGISEPGISMSVFMSPLRWIMHLMCEQKERIAWASGNEFAPWGQKHLFFFIRLLINYFFLKMFVSFFADFQTSKCLNYQGSANNSESFHIRHLLKNPPIYGCQKYKWKQLI